MGLRTTGRVRVDVRDVVHADAEGIRMLARVMQAGATLTDVPPYIRLLLARAALDE